MRGEIILRSKVGGFIEKPSIFSVGGYTFVVDDKLVPFDWNESSTNVKITDDGHMVFNAYLRYFANDEYQSDYSDLGIVPTAEFLVGAQEISEIFYECYEDEKETTKIELEVVSFSIDEFMVPEELIAKYNASVIAEN